MNLRTIIALISLYGLSASLVFGEKARSYDKAMSLMIAYDPNEPDVLTVTLANISDSKLKLMLNTKEVEGEFSINGWKEKEGSFYDKEYLRKLLTSVWFSGACELESKMTVTWSVKLDQLVYFGAGDPPVTRANLAGKSISLKLDRLAVFPAPGASNVYVDLRSAPVTIPKIEQVGAGQPAIRPESKSEGSDKPQPESEGRSR